MNATRPGDPYYLKASGQSRLKDLGERSANVPCLYSRPNANFLNLAYPGLGGGDILGEFVEAGVESGRWLAARSCRRRSMGETTHSVKAMGKPT
jgi:hypothetical protein